MWYSVVVVLAVLCCVVILAVLRVSGAVAEYLKQKPSQDQRLMHVSRIRGLRDTSTVIQEKAGDEAPSLCTFVVIGSCDSAQFACFASGWASMLS